MHQQVSSRDLQRLCTVAIGFHERGALEDAAQIYLRIAAAPAAPPSLLFTARHMLGIIRFQQGNHAEALDLVETALREEPGAADVQAVYAHMLQTMGRSREALERFDLALARKPELVQAWIRRGAILSQLNRKDEALASIDKALAINPRLADAWKKRGILLLALKRPADALASVQQALALAPDDPATLRSLGEILCACDRVDEALTIFRRHAQSVYGTSTASAPDASPHKTQHDREQQEFIGADPTRLRIAGGEKLEGPAVSIPNGHESLARTWHTSRPQILVLDDFLTREALAELQLFCLGSTIWRKSYDNGYLGAMPEHGFACPLIGQIAEELRAAYPEIFGTHPLIYFWAFKYGQRHPGIKLHADMAAINVNFWITPDDANLDPERGGMVIWDAAAPADWDFDKYNGDIASNRKFLERARARPTTIPYRANRAVIFDSDLFHETDKINFKDGYANRRINVTLLFGWRENHATRISHA